jgi:hypothetical protein
MAIAASGAVSFSDLRTEFVGGSAAISYSDLYRGGSNIRAKAANNTATNLAASVPTSGTINIANFRGTAKGFRKTYTSGATNQNASTIFGDDYAVDYRKEIVIDSGVELGATSTSEEALEIPSGGSGAIVITNNGTLSGAGGAAGGGTGGDAFEAASTCTLINNGTIRAGGGGGGAGGTGGQGSYSTSTYVYHVSYSYWFTNGYNHNYYAIRYNNNWVRGSYFSSTSQMIASSATSWSIYSRTGSHKWQSFDDDGQPFRRYAMYVSGTGYSNGGAGGAGGKGQGYVSANASGSSGSAGSNNSGAGGTGGSGGTYGNSGSTGNTGSNGNYTNGSAGSGGGASGKYITGISFVTYTNNGTNLGGTA